VQRVERYDPLECNEFFFLSELLSCQMMHSGYILILMPEIYGWYMKPNIMPVCLLTFRDKGRKKDLNASDRLFSKRGYGAYTSKKKLIGDLYLKLFHRLLQKTHRPTSECRRTFCNKNDKMMKERTGSERREIERAVKKDKNREKQWEKTLKTLRRRLSLLKNYSAKKVG